ncbi:DISARM system phospholipase D-like protein DrmC [Nocardia sp. SC052]|uniref:DISARM system phospholipase D-like protein DrmC n=1 Tax=Nocardia sichangensis TaxID=3385975 RepID=UPI0039A29F6B
MIPEDLRALVEVGTSLPPSEVEMIATAAHSGFDSLRSLRRRSAGALRHACSVVLSTMDRAQDAEVSGVLRGACAGIANSAATADIVWTGPDVPGSVSRLTSSVIASLVDEARREILLISYAMHSEPTLAAAMARAATRGVFIQLLYERPVDNPGFTGFSVPFPNLPARRLCWPAEKRPPGASMHAKALVIDRMTALIGSANITGTAMLRNIELGTLLRDRSAAAHIVESVESLMAQGIFTRCAPM